ncbi:AI-2E family transporter [Membranihabitans maritimus]|uniref:AI-2E family transporter n=1 Tax=Membranihabitans maritimus TaxID=2904244 RepID=UPI001F3258E6|nr:AI-2E family transporter [Membranihabitans maritimus]
MVKTTINWTKLSSILVSVVILGLIIVYGKTFLIPVIFSIFLSLLVLPLYHFFKKLVRVDWLSIILCFLLILGSMGLVMYFFSMQIYQVFSELSEIKSQLTNGINKINFFVADKFNLSTEVVRDWIDSQIALIVDLPSSFLSRGISSSSAFLLQSLICIVYMFFILLYKEAFKNFIISQFPKRNRKEIFDLLNSITKVSQQYFLGRLLVMVILAILNSLGLWLLGIGYPILWGAIAAVLTIFPYIGTTLGGTLPFFYAFATEESLWKPIGVVIVYQIIQQLEGNIITPKVVGGTMKLNPFASIVAMVAGGLIWGLAGLVIALPVIAIIRILFDHIELMKPFGLLLDKDLSKNKDLFLNEYDQEKYRIIDYLSRQSKQDNKKEP